MSAKQKFWTIRAAKDNPKAGEVLLYGYISNTSWWGDEVTPKQFAEDLKALGDVDTITVFINSGGGDVFAAQAIYSQLKRHKATVNTYIDGLAASAASFIAMVGETVTMPKNAMMMIHNPWSFAFGSAPEFRKMADDLDKIREPMIATYVAKTGLSEEEIAAYLDAETWFTAEDAKEAGFADVVEELKEIAASIDGDTLTINGRQVDLAPYRAFPREKVPAGGPAEPQPQAADELEPSVAAAGDARTQVRLRLARAKARL